MPHNRRSQGKARFSMDRRCEITKNICGTDTWTEGKPCLCKNCQKYLIEISKDCPSEFNKVVTEQFWELI
jgi:hypothetical protein